MTTITDRLKTMHADLRQGAMFSATEDFDWDCTLEAAALIEELRLNPSPSHWPACDCGVTFVLRKAWLMTGETRWVWQADCKHPRREVHTAILMNADGPVPQ